MSSKYLLLFFVSLASVQIVNSQNIHGVITNSEGEKLAFVHVLNKSKGTGNTSDVMGYFTIHAELNDSLIFSTVGYERYEYVLKSTPDILRIKMTRDTTLLREIIIRDTKYQEERKALKIDGLTSPENFKPIKPGTIEFGNSLNDDPNMIPVFGLHFTINGPFSYFSKLAREKRKLPDTEKLMNENLLYHHFIDGEVLQFMCKTFEITKERYLELFNDFYMENQQLFKELSEEELKANLLIYLSEMVE